MSRHRIVLLVATLAFYLATVWAVVITSWLVRLDWQVMFFRPYQQWPEIHAFLDYYVVLGQRGPTAVMISAWLGWRAWRQHTLRPLLTFGAALLLLNVTVGAAKIGMGRLGPHYATTIGSNEMGMGGDIFPSGHTANAVVTWGILAYLASTPLDQTLAVREFGADVPRRRPHHGLSGHALAERCHPRLGRGSAGPAGAAVVRAADHPHRDLDPGPARPPAHPWPQHRARPGPRRLAGAAQAARDRRGRGHGPREHHPGGPFAPGRPRTLRTPPMAPHASRSERSPVTPAGSRRPPHADRAPRATGNPSAHPLPGNG